MRHALRKFLYPLIRRIMPSFRLNTPGNLPITPPVSVYALPVQAMDGSITTLATYRGRKILVVNTASECGFTPQYAELQSLHEAHADRIAVLAFPCNQFGGQEPGSNEEIVEFCKKNYGVTFPLADKVDVKGTNTAAIYQWLTQKSKNGVLDASISWNFNKFLLDENGKMIAYYPSNVKPDSEAILSNLK